MVTIFWRGPWHDAWGCAGSLGVRVLLVDALHEKRLVSIAHMASVKPWRIRMRCICCWGNHEHMTAGTVSRLTDRRGFNFNATVFLNRKDEIATANKLHNCARGCRF